MLTAITAGILWGAFLVTSAWMLSRKIVEQAPDERTYGDWPFIPNEFNKGD